MSAVRIDSSRVEAREIDGEIVIFDLRGRRYLGGNATATALWPLLEAGTTTQALAERLRAAYDIDAAQAERDARAFVASLASLGLLVESGS